jgi:hypothetical protein
MATRAKTKKTQERPQPKTLRPLRIVPLHTAPRLGAAVAPQLTYRGGPILSQAEVFTLFWGMAWQDAAHSALSKQLNEFFDFILTSKLMDQLAEYNVDGMTISPGSRRGSLTFTGSEPGASIEDAEIQRLLREQVASGALPPANANSLYFIFLPPGTAVRQGGGESCADFCGYHDSTGDNLFYAVMPYPDCQGCLGGLATPDALTATASHELCEAITDPVPGRGWYDDAHGEVGDLCAWKTKKLNRYVVQLEWSNAAEACV